MVDKRLRSWGGEKSLLCILPPKPRGIQSVGAHLPRRHEHENIHQDFCESCKLSGNKVGVCADCDWVGLDCRPCSYKCDLSWCRRHRPSVSHLESIVQYSVICRTGLSWVIVICNWQNMILIRSSVTRTNFCFVHQVHNAHHSCRVATIAKKQSCSIRMIKSYERKHIPQKRLPTQRLLNDKRNMFKL